MSKMGCKISGFAAKGKMKIGTGFVSERLEISAPGSSSGVTCPENP
jgi:hypothetical protein